MTPDDPRHGQERGYFTHRREGEQPCRRCTDAHNVASKARALRKLGGEQNRLPSLGTIRRIRALQAIGWPLHEIAAACGLARRHESVKSILGRKYVTPRTAAVVAAAYKRLHMTTGPSQTTATRARNAGHPPPLAWDDIDNPAEVPKGVGYTKRSTGVCRKGGHPMVGSNVYVNPSDGKRSCRECRRDGMRAKRRANRVEEAA